MTTHVMQWPPITWSGCTISSATTLYPPSAPCIGFDLPVFQTQIITSLANSTSIIHWGIMNVSIHFIKVTLFESIYSTQRGKIKNAHELHVSIFKKCYQEL